MACVDGVTLHSGPLFSASARDAAAATLEKTHQRNAQVEREILGIDAFAQARRSGRAAPLGEILAADDAEPSVNTPGPENEISRRERDQVAFLIDVGVAGNRADLVKAVGVRDPIDPLPDGQAPTLVLAGHRLGPPEFLGDTPLFFDAIDFLLPAHTSVCSRPWRSREAETGREIRKSRSVVLAGVCWFDNAKADAHPSRLVGFLAGSIGKPQCGS